MKRIILVLITIALLIIIGFFLSRKETNQNNTAQQPETLSSQIKSVSGQVIDVREPDEYAADHADEAINIPLGDILKGNLSEISKDNPIYVYCRTGNRAEQAKVALEQAGYKDVTNLGGLDNWIEQKGKICSTSRPSC
jgi:phage shock protein E